MLFEDGDRDARSLKLLTYSKIINPFPTIP
jgi:hypothetical protein